MVSSPSPQDGGSTPSAQIWDWSLLTYSFIHSVKIKNQLQKVYNAFTSQGHMRLLAQSKVNVSFS